MEEEESKNEKNPNLGNKPKSTGKNLLLIKVGILMNFYLAEYILTLPRLQIDTTHIPQPAARKEGDRGTGSIPLSGQICHCRQISWAQPNLNRKKIHEPHLFGSKFHTLLECWMPKWSGRDL